MNIIFTDTYQTVPNEYKPQPASEFIPEWYKKIESYTDNQKKPDGTGKTTASIKRCMPVFDAITAGYILVTPADLYVSQKETDGVIQPFYEWANYGLIEFHPVTQAPNHPHRNNHYSYPKFINPWSIKTPKGYSVLFMQPVHRESPFQILEGVVDTDEYTVPVNFPFVLKDVNFEGLIPAGTPLVQLIPFKRDTWKMEFGTKEIIEINNKLLLKIRTRFFDGYKTFYRQKKEYK